MMRVVDGWCVFFNQGCVLHKLGASEGDKFRYKPAPCSLNSFIAESRLRAISLSVVSGGTRR